MLVMVYTASARGQTLRRARDDRGRTDRRKASRNVRQSLERLGDRVTLERLLAARSFTSSPPRATRLPSWRHTRVRGSVCLGV